MNERKNPGFAQLYTYSLLGCGSQWIGFERYRAVARLLQFSVCCKHSSVKNSVMNNMITTMNRRKRSTNDSNDVTYHNIKQLKTKELAWHHMTWIKAKGFWKTLKERQWNVRLNHVTWNDWMNTCDTEVFKGIAWHWKCGETCFASTMRIIKKNCFSCSCPSTANLL